MNEQIKATPDRVSGRNIPVAILPKDIEKFWPLLERILRTVESWTQCLAVADIRTALLSSEMQLWAMIDDHEGDTLAITQITGSARGSTCTLWLLSANLTSVSALTDRVEGFAQQMGCIALEIRAHPWWADRIPGKVTAVTIERDLRTIN